MRIVESIIEQNIDELKKDFELYSKKLFYDENSKKLIHPGEYGVYREKVVTKFLRNFLPKNYEIATGFVVNNVDKITTQCDLIIYNKDLTPLISDYNNQEFYTAETVLSIGEIKSKLNKTQFKDALNKLARNKKIKDGIKFPNIHKSNNKTFNTVKHPYDSIFSFLVCEKLDFNTDNLLQEIDGFYEEDIEKHNRHNLILSLNDGLYTFYFINEKGKTNTVHYPHLSNTKVKNLHIDEDGKYVPIKLFGSYFYQAITSHTVLNPDLIRYTTKYESQKLNFEK